MRLKSGIEVYKNKVIKSGDVYEIYTYEKPIYKGFEGKGGRHHQDNTSDEVKEQNRERVLARNQKDIRRIVNSNFNQWGELSKFLTLTFKDDIRDLKEANALFSDFVYRINYHIFGTKKSALKYLCVPEFTKKGRVHYHVAIFNMPYVPHKRLMELWGNGGLNIKKISQVDNVGAYICKYLSKDMAEKLKGKKCYFTSRGLKKPVEITDEKKVEKCLLHLSTSNKVKVKFECEFENDYTGKIKYLQCIEDRYNKIYSERVLNEHLEVLNE